jgi:sodium-dependent phosphate cotransporter
MFVEGIKGRTGADWGWSSLRVSCMCFFLYCKVESSVCTLSFDYYLLTRAPTTTLHTHTVFLMFLELMGSSFKVIGGCQAGAMFEGLTDPIAGLMVGIITTVLVQSSSTTTSIIVSLVGADAMSVRVAIPVVMGANIGTSVTNTLVSMGQMNDPDAFERAFAGATVHDMFNFLSVAVLLPIEIIFHPLEEMTNAMKPSEVESGEKWEGPIKKWVSPLSERIIIANKDVIKNVASGKTTCEAIYADDDVKGLIKCSDVYNPFTGVDTHVCPAFYHVGASRADDIASGSVTLIMSLVGLTTCLFGLVWILQKMVMGSSSAAIKRATGVNPYLAMAVGAGVTILVQSSSITTSVLTPLVGLDIIKLEQMFPLTLGANIGTTATALLASQVSSKPESVQIALCHLFFNIFGILLWFPVPFMRQWPIRAAKTLGEMTRTFRGTPLLYILAAFVVGPLILLGTSTLFDTGKAYIVIGWFLLLIELALFGKMIYFFYKQDGYNKLLGWLARRQANTDFYAALPQTIAELQEKVDNGKVKA